MRKITIISLIFLPSILFGQNGNWQGVGPKFDLPSQIFNDIENVGDTMLLAIGNMIHVNDTSLANGLAVYKNGEWKGWPLLGQNYGAGSAVCTSPSDVITFQDMVVFLTTDYDTINPYPDNGPYYQIRTWNGTALDTIGELNSSSAQFEVINNELYVHGTFTEINSTPARGVAKWDGMNWHVLEPPFGYSSPNISGIIYYDNKLVFGGNFDNADDEPYKELAYLDLTDSTWNDMDGGIKTDAYSSTGLFHVYQGDLYIGGSFRYDFGNAGHHIMKWDGETFSDVGGGLFGANYSYNAWAYSRAFIEFEGDLWVGGGFDWVGGINSPSLGIWDGVEWCVTGDSIANSAWRFVVFQDELYMLTKYINGDTVNSIAKWTGNNHRDTCGVFPLDVEELASSQTVQFTVYPNPVQDELTVQLDGVSGDYDLSIVSLDGRIVHKQGFGYTEQLSLNTASLKAGIYLLQVSNGRHQLISKFVKCE